MARFVVKNGYQKDMCHKEIELCVKSMDTNLGSVVVDTIRMGLCDCFEEIEIVQLRTAHNLGASFLGGL